MTAAEKAKAETVEREVRNFIDGAYHEDISTIKHGNAIGNTKGTVQIMRYNDDSRIERLTDP